MRLATLLSCAGFALAAIGCAKHDNPTTQAQAEPLVAPPEKVYELPHGAPGDLEATRLRLLHLGRALYIGDDESHTFEVFGAPPGAVELNELPQGFDHKLYRAKGWEKNRTGFAAIFHDDKLAFAMFTQDGLGENDIQSISTDYSDVFGKAQDVDAKQIRYRFWQDGSQRLVFHVLDRSGGSKVTLGLGDVVLMDALRMSPSSARSDIAKATKPAN